MALAVQEKFAGADAEGLCAVLQELVRNGLLYFPRSYYAKRQSPCLNETALLLLALLLDGPCGEAKNNGLRKLHGHLRSANRDLARALSTPHAAAAVRAAFTTHAFSLPSRLLLAARHTLSAG